MQIQWQCRIFRAVFFPLSFWERYRKQYLLNWEVFSRTGNCPTINNTVLFIFFKLVMFIKTKLHFHSKHAQKVKHVNLVWIDYCIDISSPSQFRKKVDDFHLSFCQLLEENVTLDWEKNSVYTFEHFWHMFWANVSLKHFATCFEKISLDWEKNNVIHMFFVHFDIFWANVP